MLVYLVLCIALACFFVGREIYDPLVLFTLPTLAYFAIPLSGDYDYLMGGALDVAILWTLSRLVRINLFCVALGHICVFSLILNFSGWILYELYFDPTFYNGAYTVLYMVVLLLITGDWTRGSSHSGFDIDFFSITK